MDYQAIKSARKSGEKLTVEQFQDAVFDHEDILKRAASALATALAADHAAGMTDESLLAVGAANAEFTTALRRHAKLIGWRDKAAFAATKAPDSLPADFADEPDDIW